MESVGNSIDETLAFAGAGASVASLPHPIVTPTNAVAMPARAVDATKARALAGRFPQYRVSMPSPERREFPVNALKSRHNASHI